MEEQQKGYRPSLRQNLRILVCPRAVENAPRMAQANSIRWRRRLDLSKLQVEGQKTTTCKHAGFRSPSACCAKGGYQRTDWIPYASTHTCQCPRSERDRPEAGTGTA